MQEVTQLMIIQKKIVPSVSFKVHLFHGALDILIISNMAVVFECAAEEVCLENKTGTEQRPYKNDSLIPDQSGQLVA